MIFWKAKRQFIMLVAVSHNVCIGANSATLCKLKNMENKYRFVSITKRFICEVPVVDLAFSKGTDDRNNFKEIHEYKLPF